MIASSLPITVNTSVLASRDVVNCFSADRPLVVQFASNNAKDFADAAELVTPYVVHLPSHLVITIANRYCDGLDLNCGCPQRCY